MSCILGIDLGTSSVKSMLLDEEQGVIKISSKSYNVDIPQVGFAEQNPELWWDAVKETLLKLKKEYPIKFSEIKVVGFSGQMHGLVLTGKDGEVLRPAILWLDQRADKIAGSVQTELGNKKMGELFHNRIFSGFAFASLLWMKEQEPFIYDKISKVLMPKDYIRFCMTGNLGTDASDASSACILNVKKREWAWEIIEKYQLRNNIFPDVHEAQEIAGVITKRCAQETGLMEGVPVIYGCGDQPAQSIGNGAVKEGIIISNIGTGGQISTYSHKDSYDSELRVHTFCHALNRAYTIFGATLCSGMSMNWLKDNVLKMKNFERMSQEAEESKPGSDGLIYLPYLTGERSPHMNSDAKGMFFGLKLQHNRKNFIRSVMEGVVFSLKDTLEIFQEMDLKADKIIASGGGASSHVWLQIQADILEKEICVCNVKEQACLGACILAGTGIGMFGSVEESVEHFVNFRKDIYEPRKEYQNMYREMHSIYKQLYKDNLGLMK